MCCFVKRAATDGQRIDQVERELFSQLLAVGLRELARERTPLKRAELYARWGLWNWAQALLERERAAGHDVPALLAARVHWMCGNSASARQSLFYGKAFCQK
jgi:hypothetical protein